MGPSQWDSGCGPERSRQEKSYGSVSLRATGWSLSPAENTWQQKRTKVLHTPVVLPVSRSNSWQCLQGLEDIKEKADPSKPHGETNQ
ncbi:Hypothetical predicted protein [Xyrichtys novacula]|uniref:Uncharacterized protein n=1 Tax=Xyrichtys novacula TaxID=13765 RepID=A0AAV1GXW2_XYRNO|nr:Hypothetical predicted protein [Xyrichtys novacula]